MVEIIAKCFKIKSSVQKLRLVVNLIKGKKVLFALDFLNNSSKKSSFLIKKLLHSVIANAEHNNNINNLSDLIIKNIFVDQGPTSKRMMPRAKGRADRILKRTSKITIIVSNVL
ncbi:50S ribosomal protein L22 [Buchnera aphidicola]|uniref:50S ribosomal protein L22 n=1 Tax=Buchnera aphidicola TaxID=9 RepID=UPI0031B87913